MTWAVVDSRDAPSGLPAITLKPDALASPNRLGQRSTARISSVQFTRWFITETAEMNRLSPRIIVTGSTPNGDCLLAALRL